MDKQVEKSIPKKIYLQYFGDEKPNMFDKPPSDGDVTWCRDKIFKYDIVYGRIRRRKKPPLRRE